MSEKLRVGIIGSGSIATGAHIPSYIQLAEKVKVVAVADVVPEKAASAASEFSIPYVYENYKNMLKEVSLDAVSVCTPNKFHAEAAIAALESDCHVICEKPPAITVKEAEQMAHTAKKAGKILTYGFHYRFAPEVEHLKRFMEAGELGNIYAGHVQAVRRRGIPGWGLFTNKELQGGGAFIDIGIHMLDAALYLMDYPEPDVILSATYQKIGTRQGVGLSGEWDWENFSVEDMGRGMIRFKNGASLTVESAFAANVEQKKSMNVALMGDKGGADLFPLKLYQEKYETLLDVTPVYLKTVNYRLKEITSFIDGCLSGKQPDSTPEQGVSLQRIIEAFYESAVSGKAVTF